MTDKRVNTIVAVEPSAVMAAFTPTEEDCSQELNTDQINEFIFVVDCSGSMQLVKLCYLFTERTTIYNEENSQKAEQLVTKMKADLGGTELMGPLQWIEQHSPNQGRARQIFLLTDEAQQEYNNALQQGHGAYLLEQDENSQDNFIITVGALLPSKECTITIAYVAELDFVQGSTIRFVVPTTIAPRYNPDKGSIASPADTHSKYVQSTPYTIEFRCRIDKIGRFQQEYIARINSPSHPIQADFAQQDAYVITFA
ncbi:unnamed protein product [Rotaria sp. Silwood2]|nr:unnamed protein product [Rotaria sp. Silwood2]